VKECVTDRKLFASVFF